MEALHKIFGKFWRHFEFEVEGCSNGLDYIRVKVLVVLVKPSESSVVVDLLAFVA